jgi:hypothetical protein
LTPPADDLWVATQTIPEREDCGYAALRLLAVRELIWLERQGGDFWRPWAAAVLGYPAWREAGRRPLIQLLYRRAPERVYDLLPGLAGERAFLDELALVWDSPLSAAFLAILTTGPLPAPTVVHTILSRLLAHKDAAAEQHLLAQAVAALEGLAQPVYLPDLLLLLLTRRPQLWPVLWSRVAEHQALALAVIRRWAAADRYQQYTPDVAEAALGEIYTFLSAVCATRPHDGVQRVQAEPALEQFRDGLLRAIARRATDAAFATLAHIAATFPGDVDKVRELERNARDRRRTAQWQPLTIQEARTMVSLEDIPERRSPSAD